MDFEYSARTRDLMGRLQAFMDEHVRPNEDAMSEQVDATVNRNDAMLVDVKDRLSTIEDVDPAQAIIDFRAQENAYQAALAVTAKVIQPSLVDFLR